MDAACLAGVTWMYPLLNKGFLLTFHQWKSKEEKYIEH